MSVEERAAIASLMWTEKYRPRVLDEVVNQEGVVSRLKSMLEKPEEMPHLLFAGPPGTGKTTVALCIARQLLGGLWRDFTLELNASDERGISTVRERVKTFARYVDRRVGVPFRIIILDEADEMTGDAQTALRRIMEESSRICRFILICNYSSRIIEPIQSRCAVFKFRRLEEEDVVRHLERICGEEGVEFDRRALELIYDVTGGDLRHAINLLQATVSLGTVSVENVEKVSGLTEKARAGEVVKLALDGRFQEAREKLLTLTRVHGMSERDFLRYAYEELLRLRHPSQERLVELMAKYDYRLVVGANPEIQLTALLAELAALGGEKKPA